MFHPHNLRQQRIVRWFVGLAIAALATSSAALVATQGLDVGIFGTQRSVIAPVDTLSDAPMSGPYELYHMEGAPTAIGNLITPEAGALQTPRERYHCSSCP